MAIPPYDPRWKSAAAAKPGKLKPGSPEYLAWAQGQMETAWRQEGLEASTLKDAIEMYAWDLGYQSAGGHHAPLPEWLVELGKHHHVDVKSQHAKGKSEAG